MTRFLIYVIAFSFTAQIGYSQKLEALKKIKRVYNAIEDVANIVSVGNQNSDALLEYNTSRTYKIYFKKINDPYFKPDKSGISEKEINNWLNKSKINKNYSEKLKAKIDTHEWSEIIYSLENYAPLELKKILISDYDKYPEKIGKILYDTKLLKSYARVVAMSSNYRTNIEFLSKVYDGNMPIKIATIESVSRKPKKESVTYVKKVIKIPFSSGVQVKGFFTEFNNQVIFEKKIPNDFFFKSSNYIYNYAFMHFQEVLLRSRDIQSHFNEKKIAEILEREILSLQDKKSHQIQNYSWHLTVYGTIQLVKSKVLKNTPHTKGRILLSGNTFE